MHGRERSRSRDPHAVDVASAAPAPGVRSTAQVIDCHASSQVPQTAWELPQYHVDCLLGKGSFGAVWKAFVGGRTVAVKSIRLRDGFREVQVLRELRGSPNVVTLLGLFQSAGKAPEDRFLNLVLEYIPDTLQRIIKHSRYRGCCLDMMHVRLYTYQLLRGMASLVRKRIVHRDLKPANLLVEPRTLRLKVCDFGTAKLPTDDEGHDQPYLCSRFYRAPELILSVNETTRAVDFWSIGVIMAEMIRGHVLFPGTDGINQFQHIVEICGTPNAAELYAMNPMYDAAVGFGPRVEPIQWSIVLGPTAPPDAVSLVGRFLKYDPNKRPLPMEAMASDFFDILRRDAAQFDPLLFRFLPEELENQHPSIRERLLAVSGAFPGGTHRFR